MTEDIPVPAGATPEPAARPTDRFERFVAERWRLLTLLFWIGTAITLLAMKWAGIHWFALGDTDDNMRFDQVRDWLNGQGWYDLRQYRLNPPAGFSIHWSRLVDLPLAAMMLARTPPFGAGPGGGAAGAAGPMFATPAAL